MGWKQHPLHFNVNISFRLLEDVKVLFETRDSLVVTHNDSMELIAPVRCILLTSEVQIQNLLV